MFLKGKDRVIETCDIIIAPHKDTDLPSEANGTTRRAEEVSILVPTGRGITNEDQNPEGVEDTSNQSGEPTKESFT